MKRIICFTFLCMCFILINSLATNAEENEYEARLDYYHKYAALTGVEWYYIAAIDQYERNTKNYRNYCPKKNEVISICFDPRLWSGISNPVYDDKNPDRILLFGGIGTDGNNDGNADRLNPDDRLSTMLKIITAYGVTSDSIEQALKDYYQTEKGVQIIKQIAILFNHFNRIDLNKRVHPIPKGYNASVVNNYGDKRSFGGPRVHEGVDIFASTGTPIVATAYGYVEVKGWNRLGGYRLGIRDIYNTYEFYAHLNSYAKGIEEGTIVRPGQVIGYVGSTGYGKEGTRGKFPPHLHFGLYKFDGKKEWSFDPYPYLKKWEKVRIS